MNLVIFVEERSMRSTLEILMPKLEISDIDYRIVDHQGKSDLRKSLRKKLPKWGTPDTRFLILHDNDGGDCKKLKEELIDIINRSGKSHATCVRIVCQELEAWFLGDKNALVKANYLKANKNPKQLLNPDKVTCPSEVLNKWKNRTKVDGAVEIAKHMSLKNNKSVSFNHTMSAIVNLTS